MSRQLAETLSLQSLPKEHADVSGKLPETAGWQPALPRSGIER